MNKSKKLTGERMRKAPDESAKTKVNECNRFIATLARTRCEDMFYAPDLEVQPAVLSQKSACENGCDLTFIRVPRCPLGF
jgi:hypothetical protein